MNTPTELKNIVKDKYGKIALTTIHGCSSTGCCSPELDYSILTDEYKNIDGYVAEADLGLGCGLPTQFAEIREGQTVVDLGSGAGNDAFVARRLVGESGRVIGLDMTPEMVFKAKQNNAKLGYTNTDFVLGEIEDMPIEDGVADVVISNCVLNLVPDKNRAFGEMHRILKLGGRFCISDLVLQGELPDAIRQAAAMYAGCISGALQKSDYLAGIEQAGFEAISVLKEKAVELPDDLLLQYITENELESFRKTGAAVLSITVTGSKV